MLEGSRCFSAPQPQLTRGHLLELGTSDDGTCALLLRVCLIQKLYYTHHKLELAVIMFSTGNALLNNENTNSFLKIFFALHIQLKFAF